MLDDTPLLVATWQMLVVKYDCKGKPSHDARIVAAMLVHDVLNLLTFNGRDFLRYSEISLIDPLASASQEP